ncbi:MAG: hypothetical protein CMB73_02650 [Euryarchaeota archaeon]|nr:hypothetical protein [Euryarchaeota archaeon]
MKRKRLLVSGRHFWSFGREKEERRKRKRSLVSVGLDFFTTLDLTTARTVERCDLPERLPIGLPKGLSATSVSGLSACWKKEFKGDKVGDKVEVFSGTTSTDVYEWRVCRNRACPFRARVSHLSCGRGAVEAWGSRLLRWVFGVAVLGLRGEACVQRVRGGRAQREM